ncbi:MAG: DUF2059 domain-containing protein [Alphaproteobacteria bacterium]|nr:DUF2059 domain-containing protein [Alphaproteobacteria bacterium]
MTASGRQLFAKLTLPVFVVNSGRQQEIVETIEETTPKLISAFYPVLTNEIARPYGWAFSPQEIVELVAFYGSPFGQEVARNTQLIASHLHPLAEMVFFIRKGQAGMQGLLGKGIKPLSKMPSIGRK